MPSQRVCGDERQIRNRLSNGPLRAQSNGIKPRVFCDVKACVNCRGYDGIPQELGSYRESRWHRG